MGGNPVNWNDPNGLAARAIGNAATQTVSYFASRGMADLFPQGAPIVTTGQAFGALAAYAQGVATGNSSLTNVAIQGMAENKQNNLDTLVMLGTMGRGGAKTNSINPNTIRFSQSSVNGTADLVKSMKANGWKGDAIDVVKMGDGGMTTIDNTRVLAASRAGINVQANIRNASDPLPANLVERFTTKQGVPSTWGEAVQLRIGKQNSAFRNNYPNGSSYTGSVD